MNGHASPGFRRSAPGERRRLPLRATRAEFEPPEQNGLRFIRAGEQSDFRGRELRQQVAELPEFDGAVLGPSPK
jgi:hypothetical protein